MKWKRGFGRLLFPGWGFVLLCVLAAAGGHIYVFSGNRQESWAAYLIYAGPGDGDAGAVWGG